MNGLFVYLPSSVGLEDIAQLLDATHEIQDQTRLESPQVVVDGTYAVYIRVIDEDDNAGCWPSLPEEVLGDFACIGFLSADLARIVGPVARVVEHWPALIDDDRGHVFAGSDYLNWYGRHRAPAWGDEPAGPLTGMPILETYDCDEGTAPPS